MRPLLSVILALACLAASVGAPGTAHAADPVKVAIIVGPVGTLTPTYLNLAETAASTAERHGATVARAYSPNATPGNVLAAVADAQIVIYFGHGSGYPSPYGGLDSRRQNGWGLQGPRARGTHDDGLNGYLEYFGEDWIVANARPAPGFVMIYSNTCYAPGASEGGFAPATPAIAAERVAYYSRKVFTMGGSAYYATDFDRGAADLVDRLLSSPGQTYGSTFAADPRFVPGALTTQAHLISPGRQIWLHRTKYTDGPPNYWYAFAGNPDATPMRAWDSIAPTAALESPGADATDVPPWATLTIRLSESVVGLGPPTVSLEDEDGRSVDVTLEHDQSAGTLTITPAAPLSLSSHYTVAVATGIADLAGNGLPPAAWSFTTRIDADPLSASVPVVLASGRHDLVKLLPGGSVAEQRSVEVPHDRWVVASSRARLPGQAGSWLELGTGSLAGWWIAESAHAHAVGLIEAATLSGATVSIPAGEYAVSDVVDASLVQAAEVAVRAERSVGVDRRTVVGGRTYLRIADGLTGHVGRWIEVAPGAAPADASESRLLSRQLRPVPAQISLPEGDRTIFRFDDAGHVVERGTISGPVSRLVTEETLVVGASRFLVIEGGPFDGWSIADGPTITVLQPQARDRS